MMQRELYWDNLKLYIERGEVGSRNRGCYQMLELFMFLVFLPCFICKAETLQCTRMEIPILHEWFQPGDILIGGMASQFVFDKIGLNIASQDVFGVPG